MTAQKTQARPHSTGTREEWEAALNKLLEREQDMARRSEELARQRRELPWLLIEKKYTFDTDQGTKTLAELFDGRSQLLIYHMMFGPQWTAACPACSALVDHIDGGLVHLNQHDVTMVCVSHAPLSKLQAYKKRMGWRFNYVSSFGSDFNHDFGVSFTEEQRKGFADTVLAQFSTNPTIAEMAASCGTDLAGYVTTEAPGLSAFGLEDGLVYRTYACTPPHAPLFIMGYELLLERTPKGHDDTVVLRRHDEYADARALADVR